MGSSRFLSSAREIWKSLREIEDRFGFFLPFFIPGALFRNGSFKGLGPLLLSEPMSGVSGWELLKR